MNPIDRKILEEYYAQNRAACALCPMHSELRDVCMVLQDDLPVAECPEWIYINWRMP